MSNFTIINKCMTTPWLVLPTVYTDALSYYEQVNKLCYVVNQLIDNNNNIPDYIQEILNQFLESGEITDIITSALSEFILNVKYPPQGIPSAKGDGLTDDTETFTKCIEYAKKKGGVVFIPYGSYLMNNLDLNGVSLFGMDKHTTKIVAKGGISSPFIKLNKAGIYGITVDGNSNTQVNDITGIQSSNCSINEVIIKDCYTCISAESGNIDISNISLTGTGHIGISITGETTLSGNNVYISGLQTMESGIKVDAQATAIITNIVSNLNFGAVIDCKGNNSKFTGNISGNANMIKNTGTNNVIAFNGYIDESCTNVSKSGNRLTENYETVNRRGSHVTENFTNVNSSGSQLTENFTNVNRSGETKISKFKSVTETATEKTVNSDTTVNGDVFLNTNAPLKYGEIEDKYGTKVVAMRDKNDNPYFINVYDPISVTPESDLVLNNHFLFRTVNETKSEYWTADTYYGGVQGGCIVNNNIVCLYPTTSNTNDTLLIEFSKNGNQIRSAILPLGHGNDICYNDGKLYVVPNEYWIDGQFRKVNYLFVVDYNTLTLTQTVVTSQILYGCCFFNDKIYSLTNVAPYNQIVSVNLSTGDTTNEILITDTRYTIKFPPTLQTMCCDKEYIYILTAYPSTIIKVNRSGNIEQFIGVPYESGQYPINEAEFCDIDSNGTFILAGATYTFSYTFSIFFEYGDIFSSDKYDNAVNIGAYIDNVNSKNTPDGSKENPYYCLDEIFLKYRFKKIGVITAIINGNGKNYLYSELYDSTIEVRGNNNPVIQGLGLSGCTALLSGLIINNHNQRGEAIAVRNSTVFFGTNSITGNIYSERNILQFSNLANIPENCVIAYNSKISCLSPITVKFLDDQSSNCEINGFVVSSGNGSKLPFRNGIIANYPAILIISGGTVNLNGNNVDNLKLLSRKVECTISEFNACGNVYYEDSTNTVKIVLTGYRNNNKPVIIHGNVDLKNLTSALKCYDIESKTDSATNAYAQLKFYMGY